MRLADHGRTTSSLNCVSEGDGTSTTAWREEPYFLQTPSTPTGTARRSVCWRTSRLLCASPPPRFTRDTTNNIITALLGGNQTTVITPTTAALRAGIINAGRNIRDEVHHPVGTVLSTMALQRMPRMPTAALRAGIINAGRNIRHKALQDEVHHPVETVLSTIALQRMPRMPS